MTDSAIGHSPENGDGPQTGPGNGAEKGTGTSPDCGTETGAGVGRSVPTVAPTGTQHTIAAGGYRAVLTEVGAGIRSLTYDDRPLLMDYPAGQPAVGGAGQLLLPWPNRVEDGRYDFDGQTRQLAISEPRTGHATHGFTRWLPWTVLAEDATSIRFRLRLFPQLGYPHVLDLTVAYSVSPSGLEVEVAATNVGASAAPYGMGAHPYLTLGTGHVDDAVDDAVLELPAAQWLEVDDRKIPIARHGVEGTDYDFRTARPVGGLALDTPFTGLRRDADGLVRVRLRSADASADGPADGSADGAYGVELWAGDGIEWLQVYTGDTLPDGYRRAGIAVEPMSCPPNAFATGEDLIRLTPGDHVSHRWGVRAWPDSARA
ncbi:aldose 1-epimerase family protein [Planotetraspora sp. A-T 1434]|uniref:aldose 1-epimerase family protein n=1 Tax=Planotetraspora sp. A-T 1434 TaxID=2979219 RepID=UPI0021C1B84E|nr:aldose 1-epimerase family protein [Planotetraspora sp. A-T 1434]MCT9933478.1 aldose 1-epimerase family protein [Planotetraspora sp. A-T 1434]